jgi:hypothetical protein
VIEEIRGVICLRKPANGLLNKVAAVCIHRVVALAHAIGRFGLKKVGLIIETVFVFLGIPRVLFFLERSLMGIARTCVLMAGVLRSLDLQNLVRIIGPVRKVGVLSNF